MQNHCPVVVGHDNGAKKAHVVVGCIDRSTVLRKGAVITCFSELLR